MHRRIYGLETEYGITCALNGQRRLTPDEVARYLFRSVVQWGRSSNVFLENGGRLYLDVGSHPEFATPECDSIVDVCRYDAAGERILNGLVTNAEQRMKDEGIRGSIYLFKNNTDSAGNSYGCHENYLMRREHDSVDLEAQFIPFLVARQLVAGAGKLVQTSKGPVFSLSQRAEHVWESVSSATTRSRPIINTRDEPHADADIHRRLHVIVGDSNMSPASNILKVGTAAIVLRMLEEPAFSLRDLRLESPIRSIREISMDVTGRRSVRLASGREMSALDIHSYLLEKAHEFDARFGFLPEEQAVLGLWSTTIESIEAGRDDVSRVLDWAMKKNLIEAWTERNKVPMDSPRVSALDLQFHDIDPVRGVYARLDNGGLVDHPMPLGDVAEAETVAPATTRAHLRGLFVKTAKAAGRDYTVDWVHLKINDQNPRSVACKDPFANSDPAVTELLAALQG